MQAGVTVVNIADQTDSGGSVNAGVASLLHTMRQFFNIGSQCAVNLL